MALKFNLRSTSLTPWFSYEGRAPGIANESNGDTNPVVVEDSALSGVFGGKLINFQPTAFNKKYLIYPGFRNAFGKGPMSVEIRLVPSWSGAPSQAQPLFTWGLDNSGVGGAYGYIDTDGKLQLRRVSEAGNNMFAFVDVEGLTFVEDVPTTIRITWDGTDTTNAAKLYQDGVLVAQTDGIYPGSSWDEGNGTAPVIRVGVAPFSFEPQWKLNEFNLWDSVEVPAGAPAGFLDVPAFNGSVSTDPGEANVAQGTSYVIEGVAKEGTLVPTPASTDPGQANVRAGTNYTFEGAAKTGQLVVPSLANTKVGVAGDGGTGTYDGSDRWSDPGQGNVSAGIEYKANSLTNNRTGTRNTVTNEVGDAVVEGDDSEGQAVFKIGRAHV